RSFFFSTCYNDRVKHFNRTNANILVQSHQSCSEKGCRGIPLPGFQGCPLVFPLFLKGRLKMHQQGNSNQKGAFFMSTEDNIAIVHRYLDEVVNTGNLDAARNLFATDHVAHYAGFPSLHGHEDWKQLTSMSYTGFPDTFTTFEDEMAAGDKVVVRYLVRATHKGD